MIVLLLPL